MTGMARREPHSKSPAAYFAAHNQSGGQKSTSPDAGARSRNHTTELSSRTSAEDLAPIVRKSKVSATPPASPKKGAVGTNKLSGRTSSGRLTPLLPPSSGRSTPQGMTPSGSQSTSPTKPRPPLGSSVDGMVSSQAAGLNDKDNIKVVIRVRPLNARELDSGTEGCIVVPPAQNSTLHLTLLGPKAAQTVRPFSFHGVLGPDGTQADLLRACAIPTLLDAALSGFHVTIFAYGQTGSGKTYTMAGREEVLALEDYSGDTDDGIMTRAAMYLFEQKERRGALLKASYCEIYNEAIYDLLNFTNQQLPVRWDAAKGFYVPDLFVKECAEVQDLLQVISRGMANRKIGSHQMNLESSRSHSIATVYCETGGGDTGEIPTFGKVSFVDLAGSERVKDTRTAGGMLKETTAINRSLFTLGKVISALAEGSTAHIPYRDSKLTKLLMDSLGGSALALMIACCSPASTAVEETLSTLTYATRAKNIHNRPVVQQDAHQAAIAALQREIKLLRAENAFLRDQAAAGALAPALAHRLTADLEDAKAGSETKEEGPAMPMTEIKALVPSLELKRLAEAEEMVARFSRENQWLAMQNDQLRTHRKHVDSDYVGALEEVDWLRNKLEFLEKALRESIAGKTGPPGSLRLESDSLVVNDPGSGEESLASLGRTPLEALAADLSPDNRPPSRRGKAGLGTASGADPPRSPLRPHVEGVSAQALDPAPESTVSSRPVRAPEVADITPVIDGALRSDVLYPAFADRGEDDGDEAGQSDST